MERGGARLDVGADGGRLVVDRLRQRLTLGRGTPEVLPGAGAAGVRDDVQLHDARAQIVELDLRAVFGRPQLRADQHPLRHVRLDGGRREAVSLQVILEADRDGRVGVTYLLCRLGGELDALVLPGRVGHRHDQVGREEEAERDQAEHGDSSFGELLDLGHGLASHVRRERISHIN